MNKARRIATAGLGAMTPAFLATDQIQARTVEGAAIGPAQSGEQRNIVLIRIVAIDQEALKRALLELSPAEKLRIAGDRIRLAAKAKVVPRSSARPVTDACASKSCYTSICTTVTCAGAPRRAR